MRLERIRGRLIESDGLIVATKVTLRIVAFSIPWGKERNSERVNAHPPLDCRVNALNLQFDFYGDAWLVAFGTSVMIHGEDFGIGRR